MTDLGLQEWLDEQKKDAKNRALSDGTILLHGEDLIWQFIGKVAVEVQIDRTFWDHPIAFQMEIKSMIQHHLEVYHGPGTERLCASLISIRDSIAAHQKSFVPDPDIEEPEDPRDGKVLP